MNHVEAEELKETIKRECSDSLWRIRRRRGWDDKGLWVVLATVIKTGQLVTFASPTEYRAWRHKRSA